MTLSSSNIKVLRVQGSTSNISADVFEDIFRFNIGTSFSTDYLSVTGFVDVASEKSRLCSFLQSYDYICPDYTIMAVVPWIMQVRNQNNLSIGVLFITHSPGIYALEWYLMRDMICAKDIIISPSFFSKSVITLLAPSLQENIEVIHHPLHRLRNADGLQCRRGRKIVTLSRIVEDKLIHRQIDAMHMIVHNHGYEQLQMFIGGALHDPESGELTAYARLLIFKIKRLGLEANVYLTGEVSAEEKGEFFRDSFVSVNLSRTLEEAFPKVTVEALSFGIPVVATLWNGFKETVGSAGVLLELEISSTGKADVSTKNLARAIISLYEEPVSEELCDRQMDRFDPSTLKERYRSVVTQRVLRGTDKSGEEKTRAGLLDSISFLKMFSFAELMAYHNEWVETYFVSIKNKRSALVQTSESFFRVFIADALEEILTTFYAYKIKSETIKALYEPSEVLPEVERAQDFRGKMHQSIYLSKNIHSQRTLLKVFAERPDLELLKEAIVHFSDIPGDALLPSYYLPFYEYLEGNYEKVCRFYQTHFMSGNPEIEQADQLCLWARAARKCNDGEHCILYLARWLNSYETEPEAMDLHVEYLKLLIDIPDIPAEIVDLQFDIINALCVDQNYVQKLRIVDYAR